MPRWPYRGEPAFYAAARSADVCDRRSGRVCPAARLARAVALLPSDAAADRRFSVLYDGARIGAHAVSYSVATGETRITTEIDLMVKVAFFTVYAFSHRSTETWFAGQLQSLTSETVEHGEATTVNAQNWITCGNALRLDWLSI